jgi:hypothetical protein
VNNIADPLGQFLRYVGTPLAASRTGYPLKKMLLAIADLSPRGSKY